MLSPFEQGGSRERADLIEAPGEAEPSRSLGLVEQAFADSNNRVAGNACLALYRAGDCRALTRLAEMIRSPQPEFQVTAAWAMGQLRDARFAPLLRDAAGSGIPTLRRDGLRSLAGIEKIEASGVATDLQPVFVSAPPASGSSELWIRVLRPDGGFVEGLQPIDFFAFGPSSVILDYSVLQCRDTLQPSLLVAWPLGHRTCENAIGPGAESRVHEGYDGTPASLQTCCRNLLKRAPGGINRHPAVFLEEYLSGVNWKALYAECHTRDIRLHCWRIGKPGERDVSRLWSEFLASFDARYVVHSWVEEPVRHLAIREAGGVPPRFSPGLSVGPAVIPPGNLSREKFRGEGMPRS